MARCAVLLAQAVYRWVGILGQHNLPREAGGDGGRCAAVTTAAACMGRLGSLPRRCSPCPAAHGTVQPLQTPLSPPLTNPPLFPHHRCGWGGGRRLTWPSSSWARCRRWGWRRGRCSTTPAEVRAGAARVALSGWRRGAAPLLAASHCIAVAAACMPALLAPPCNELAPQLCPATFPAHHPACLQA